MANPLPSLFDIPLVTLEGRETSLAEHRGKVLLIVNVASQCGFTPQYAGLEALHRSHGPRGLAVLGFPCNQFGAQEPGDAAAIRAFCSARYDVTFPLYAKLDVNGSGTHPLYQALKARAKGILGTESIKWNFTKFLVSADGELVERYATNVTPAELTARVDALLAER